MKNARSKWVPMVSLALACVLPLQQARAGLVATEDSAAGAALAAERERVQRFVAREDVVRELEALGVAPDVAKERVAALSQEEVASLAGKIENLPAGARVSSNDLIVILLLLIVLVILL